MNKWFLLLCLEIFSLIFISSLFYFEDPLSISILLGIFILLISFPNIHFNNINEFKLYLLLAQLFLWSFLSFLLLTLYFSYPIEDSSLYLLSVCLFILVLHLVIKYLSSSSPEPKKNTSTLIIGAGEATSLLIKELDRLSEKKNIIGILDDDSQKVGMEIEQIPVLGHIDSLSKIVREKKIKEVIISIEQVSSQLIHRILDQIDTKKIMVRIIPTEKEVIFKSMNFSQTRTITPEDLLGRKESILDTKLIKSFLKNKVVLITGAGGSIGSDICYQLLYYPIKKLVCISRGEYSLYNLEKRLSKNNILNVNINYFLGNIQDMQAISEIVQEHKPNIIFHAAAYKHVPILENQEKEAIKNNVIGTHNILEIAQKNKVEKFILISTDKAIKPQNIMGASKRIAEIICQQYFYNQGLNASIVRFGNVLGSRGSVVPLFLEQIETGGPVTVTHPEVVRYFMSIKEASRLVINCSAYSKGGEKFILDMGSPIKIDNLVKKMIRLHGFEPNRDIKVKYTGLRPGEKLIEEIISKEEDIRKTDNNKIFISTENLLPSPDIYDKIDTLLSNIDELSSSDIRSLIKKIVPEFKDASQGYREKL